MVKSAGPKEAGRADGLIFDQVAADLAREGSEVSKEIVSNEVKVRSDSLISSQKRQWILSLKLEESETTSADEKALVIIGAALTSDSEESARSKVKDFDLFLKAKNKKNKPKNDIRALLQINQRHFKDIEELKTIFNDLHMKVQEANKSKGTEEGSTNADSYISNEVIYNFDDGWNVVYVPAVGEIKPFPGLEGTSHDRIVEGNKNGTCLGSERRMYQDNSSGKIYSVRDPEGIPRVTIRINGNKLEEAKGRFNTTPDIEGSAHAQIWFKTIPGLNYKECDDFKRFPPPSIYAAKYHIDMNPSSAYDKGWAPYWYGRGIQTLDQDIEKKFKENSPDIIKAAFGKHSQFFEKTKPVALYWCKRYLELPESANTDEAEEVLFGDKYNAKDHEVYKTYKEEEVMRRAVKKLSERNPLVYFNLHIQEIPKYRDFSEVPIKHFIENNTFDFLNLYPERWWAKPYVDLAIEKSLEDYPSMFLLEKLSEKEWLKPYLDRIIKSAIEEDPRSFMEQFSEAGWAINYKNLASKAAIDWSPYWFKREFSDKDWANIPVPEAGNKTWAAYAQAAIDAKESAAKKINSGIKTAKRMSGKKLLKLAKVLRDLNLTEYAEEIKTLSVLGYGQTIIK